MTDTALTAPTTESPAGLQITARTLRLISSSTLIPDTYRGDEGSVAICLDMANRMGLPVLTVLQNLHVIKGRPSWSASFLIGAVNASGRFGPLRFRQVGERGKPSFGFYAEAKDLADGEMLQGEPVTLGMAKAEGWATRKGTKYKTMPGQMLRYRAAAFWARLYAPEIAHGLLTSEEAQTLPDPTPARAKELGAAITDMGTRAREAGAAAGAAAAIRPARETVDRSIEEVGGFATTETVDPRTGEIVQGVAETAQEHQPEPIAGFVPSNEGPKDATPSGPGIEDVFRINQKVRLYRRGEPDQEKWDALKAEAARIGLTFDPKSGEYVR